MGIALIKPDDSANAEYNSIVDTHFCGLFNTMMTLFQGVTLDSFSIIYTPIVLAKPYLIVYFGSFILLLAIALMNLVTATMVEASLEAASKDKEAVLLWRQDQKKEEARELYDLFLSLDADGSNKISNQELINAPEEVQSRMRNLCNIYSMEEIFRLLDFDDNGEVDIKEFCDGILRTESGAAKDFLRIEKLLRKIYNQLVSQSTQCQDFPQSNHSQVSGLGDF